MFGIFTAAWGALLEFAKSRSSWKAIQPVATLAFTLVAAELLAFEFVRYQYGFSPSLRLFLASYISRRIALAFLALGSIALLFRLQPGRGQVDVPGRLRGFLQAHLQTIIFRSATIVVVVAITLTILLHGSPKKVSHIRIKFLDEPRGFSPDAFAYMMYELNRRQASWHFDVDFSPFNPRALSSKDVEACSVSERPTLCRAESYADGEPLVGITGEPLGQARFWEHHGTVSVISTADSSFYAPVSTYEYLAFCVVVQSLLIHLDAAGGGLPPGAFEESRSSHGGVFQFNPRREAVRALILSAQLSPGEEEMLFNRFGAEYTSRCKSLLGLEWLHSERVRSNLRAVFDVRLAGTAAE